MIKEEDVTGKKLSGLLQGAKGRMEEARLRRRTIGGGQGDVLPAGRSGRKTSDISDTEKKYRAITILEVRDNED